jgi:hypothetical protein
LVAAGSHNTGAYKETIFYHQSEKEEEEEETRTYTFESDAGSRNEDVIIITK